MALRTIIGSKIYVQNVNCEDQDQNVIMRSHFFFVCLLLFVQVHIKPVYVINLMQSAEKRYFTFDFLIHLRWTSTIYWVEKGWLICEDKYLQLPFIAWSDMYMNELFPVDSMLLHCQSIDQLFTGSLKIQEVSIERTCVPHAFKMEIYP